MNDSPQDTTATLARPFGGAPRPAGYDVSPGAAPDVLLAAAHHFLSAERLATELNVLAIVGLTGLESTPKTSDELRAYIKRHTGVRPPMAVVEHAIAVLVGARLAEPAGARWTATPAGREQVQQSLQWAATSRAELERAVCCAAVEDGLADAQVRVPQLTDVLLKVLEETLFTAIISEGRGVEKVGDHLVPGSLDLPAMVGRAAELLPTDPDAQHVLAKLLRRALSPADSFATDQVTDLVTAALIQLVVSHQDEADLRRAVGSFTGVTVVVDTPIALLLLAEDEVVANTEQILRQAVECGVDLRFGPTLVGEVTSCVRAIGATSLRDKVDDRFHLDDLDLILDVIEGDGILNSYVRGRWRGRYDDWDAFEAAARALTGRLRELGAREIGFPGEDSSDVAEFLAEHNRTIERRRLKDPGTRGARADARLMAFLQRARKKQPSGVWPAAWLLSPDTHVPETYRTVTKEREPATLTLGQLGALLLRFADSDNRVRLARAATGTLRRDALFATSARVPASVVARLVEIATSPEITPVDRKKIKRGIAGLLDRAESETDVEAVIAEVTNQVLTESGGQIRRRYETAVDAADARVVSAEAAKDAAERREQAARQEAAEAHEREQRKDKEAEEARAEARRQRSLRNRERVLLLVLAACAVAAYRFESWSIIGMGGGGVIQAWVLWGEHLTDGRHKPYWPAVALAAVSAALGLRGLF